MEPEGSILRSQVPAICPYPEPARSSPYPHTPSWRATLILSSQVISFPQVSPPKPCIRLFCPPYVLHAPAMSWFEDYVGITRGFVLYFRASLRRNVAIRMISSCLLHNTTTSAYSPVFYISKYPLQITVIYSWHCWPCHDSGTYSPVTHRGCGHSVPDSQWTDSSGHVISEVWLTPVSIPSLLHTLTSVTVAVC